MKRTRQSSRREPTISLINIIFLILIFFMVTGTLSRPTSSGFEFVQTPNLECCSGSGILQIDAGGALFVRDKPISSLRDYLASLPKTDPTVRIAPDRRLAAKDLLTTVSTLREMTDERILIITENSGT